MNENVCEACGKTITDGSIHSKYGVVCSGACYDHMRGKELEAAAKVIEKPSDFKEWEGQNMSEIFWIHLGKYVKHPNKYSLSLMRNAYSWAMHADHGLSNSFRNALKWAKMIFGRRNQKMMNSEMFNCWTGEIRDYFGVDVSDDTVQLVRNKIESIFLEYLRPKMEWKPQFSKEYGYVIYHCSNCGNDELVKTLFCPQCGAMYAEDLK